jgi:hypothetical protein
VEVWVAHRLNPIAVVLSGCKGTHVGVAEHRYVPSGWFRAGDNDARVGAEKVGAEQSDDQLMMADQRGLSRLDARLSEHALLTSDHPGIEPKEIDLPTSLDELGEGGLNAGRRVQIQL